MFINRKKVCLFTSVIGLTSSFVAFADIQVEPPKNRGIFLFLDKSIQSFLEEKENDVKSLLQKRRKLDHNTDIQFEYGNLMLPQKRMKLNDLIEHE